MDIVASLIAGAISCAFFAFFAGILVVSIFDAWLRHDKNKGSDDGKKLAGTESVNKSQYPEWLVGVALLGTGIIALIA